MKKVKLYTRHLMLLTAVVSLVIFAGCNDATDPDPKTEDPIASFQFEVDATDFLKVTFSNFSQNATAYSWDFGDGAGTSTDENPTYTYAAAGSFTVALTATNGDGVSSTKSEKITLNDPLAAQRVLIGDNGKVWQLIGDASTGVNSYQVGPADRGQIWWSLGGVEPLCVRECILDDTWTFNTDGTYTFENNGDFWAEGAFKADLNGSCFDASDASNFVGENGEDLSGWNSGTHNFTFSPVTSKLTVNGGFIGIPKAADNAEVSVPAASVTYTVVKLVDATVDTLVVETYIDGGYWQSTLVSYDNPSDKVVVGECAPVESVNVTFKVNMNDYSGTFTTMYVSGSFNNWSGDGNPMTDADQDGIWELTREIPVGEHEYKFTIDNWAAQEEFTEGTSCTITKDGFTNRYLDTGTADKTVGPYCFNQCANCAVAVTNADLQGKAWHLKSGPGAVRVGPGMGLGDWFTNDQAWADAGPCLFDDTFTFGSDGSLTINVGAEVFTESHMNGIEANGCVAVGNLPANLTNWGGGAFTYTFTAGTESASAKITVTGNGAYLGFYKGANGSEPKEPQAGSITYEVLSYTGKMMEVSVDISGDQNRSAAWTMVLVTD